ncbi:MAG: thioredoxin family protein [Pseudomonadota bacterium]
MNVMIIATKDCSHYTNLARELDGLGVEYRLVYAEDEPELVQKYGIRHSPNLIVDDEVKFRRQPTEQELRECLNC